MPSDEEDNFKEIMTAVRDLADTFVIVGVPESEAARNDVEGITNAQIGYISEYGAPEANIPARPWLVPGIREAKRKINDRMGKVRDAALIGDHRRVRQQLEGAGQDTVSTIQNRIDSGIAPALSESTLKARKRKGFNGETPLVRTHQFVNSIDYVVSDDKSG